MRTTWFFFLSFLFVHTAWTQERLLTIEDAVLAYSKGLYPENRPFVWLPDSKAVAFYDPTTRSILSQPTDNSPQRTLCTLDQVNRVLAQHQIDPLRTLYGVEWVTNSSFRMFASGHSFIYHTVGQSLSELQALPADGENWQRSAAGALAFTRGNNLYVLTPQGEQPVTTESDPGIVCGQTVHRNEFGISGGIFWSPSGKYLAYYRKDQRAVADYPIVDITTRIATVRPEKYPMAGATSEHVSLWVFDLATGKNVQMQTGLPAEQYLTNVAWHPSEELIYIAVLNRDQNHLHLNSYRRTDGVFVKTLFEERNNKWVEPENPMQFLPNTPNYFVWQSERDGFNQLYLYQEDGKLIRQLTSGKQPVVEFLGADTKARYAFAVQARNLAMEQHLVRIDLKTGAETLLTTAPGTHRVVLSPDATFFVDSYSALDVPNTVTLCNQAGKSLLTLLQAKDPMSEYESTSIELLQLTAADGRTPLNARLVKPHNFDPTKKYPLIVYVYAGPHVQLVQNSWMGAAQHWQLYMAHKGYVSLTVDSRGSANRGFEFESAIHRQLGDLETADQVAALRQVMEKGFVDSTRIGVHGWSYGGFMTTSLMTRYPELFKVGVAGGPVIDWKYYEVMYGERYMDTPEQNPEGYQKASLLNQARNLKGRLLMIHGDIDPVVVWQHSLAFVQACVKERVQLDYFVYPQHEHNVRGYDRVHLMDKVSRYFDDFLK